MKTAIILHGRPSEQDFYNPDSRGESNAGWIPWLQHELVVRDVLAQAPELPRPFKPNYKDWKTVFEQLQPDENTLLVGHSYGAGFLVNWLSENTDKRVGRVILVAPSLGYGFDDRKDFFGFEIDSAMADRTKGMTIVVAKDDTDKVLRASKELAETIKNIKTRRLNTGGHFTFEDMKTDKFPELLEEILK